MENSATPELRWSQLGPDLSKFPEEEVRYWVGTFGEIRLRYGANRTRGMDQ